MPGIFAVFWLFSGSPWARIFNAVFGRRLFVDLQAPKGCITSSGIN